MKDSSTRKSGHAAGHEAADRNSHVAAYRPYHGPSCTVGFGNDGVVRDIDPLVVEAHAVVAVMGFPIDVLDRSAVGIRAAGALAGSELVEPAFQRRIGIAAVVAGLQR